MAMRAIITIIGEADKIDNSIKCAKISNKYRIIHKITPGLIIPGMSFDEGE